MYGQPGYPPMGGQPQPMGGGQYMPDEKDRQWAMIAHLSPLVVGFIGPLILMMVDTTGRGQPSPFVKHAAKQSLIWCIALIVIGMLTCGIGALVMMIWQVLAGVAANRGEWYVYPGLSGFVDPV
ncbi:MAG: DUF4870 domain-containing protein [Sandaracinaceae bacterium]|nr:DUF4870 domain-containing protein [Sandaracinaceae bacterium]